MAGKSPEQIESAVKLFADTPPRSNAEARFRRLYQRYLVRMQFPNSHLFDEIFDPHFTRLSAEPITRPGAPAVPTQSGIEELRAQQQHLLTGRAVESVQARIQQDDEIVSAYVLTNYNGGEIFVAQTELVVLATSGLVRARIEMTPPEMLPQLPNPIPGL